VRIGYGTYLRDGGDLRAEAMLAEASGLDAMFFSEHHGIARYPPSPLALAHYALGATSTLRAGPMPLLLPLHHPLRIAEESALIDHVSGGRLIMGLATGYLEDDFEQVGVPLAERGARLDEGIAILRQLWRGEPQRFAGPFHTIGGTAPLSYLPADAIPIWLATGTPRGFRRAVRCDAGIVLDSVQPRSAIERAIRRYRELCADAGAAPRTVAVMRRIWLGGPDEVERFLDGYAEELARYVHLSKARGGPGAEELRDGEGISRRRVLERVSAGEPEAVADALGGWCAEHGVDYLIIKVQWGGGAPGAVETQLRRARVLCERLSEG
jgi:alkanesulfonate monooxygenase SsuD/methylene tetrahydromethanopterin reductase-like flavin-dependent oxidoreductase (luciferase family)